MLYLTQLVYVQPGKETEFEAFERVACGLLSKYGGRLLLRLRPSAACVVSAETEVPYEVHFLSFDTAQGLAGYSEDPERQGVLHLKAASVRTSLLVQGQRVD